MSASDESTELLALLSMITSAELLPIVDVPAIEAVAAAPSASALDLFALSGSASTVTDSSASGTDDAPHDQESCASDREEGAAKKQRREQPRERPAKKRTRKPCKPTYYVRKEEKTALLQEIQSLKAQVEYLQFQPPTPGLSTEDAMARNQLANMFLRDEVVRQQYALARLQSAQAGYVSAQDTLPYQTPIRLGKDWSERRATLAATKNQILRDAVRYVTERSQFLDLSMPHSETSRYVTANGDFCALRFDIDQIHGAKSVKQVFDALQSFFFSIEISISEVMGDIMIREDDDHQELGISQLRYVSNVANATAQVEINCAMFCDFLSGSGSNGDGSSNRDFGVITTDFIDEDELYPYSPGQRMRQDVTATATVAPLMRKKKRPTRGRQPHQECQDGDNGDSEEEELVIVLTRSSLLKLHRSDVVVPLHTQQQMREQIGRWGDFFLKKLRENLTSAAAT